MSKKGSDAPGILRPAPEGFLDEGTIGEISGQGIDARRRTLLKSSFMRSGDDPRPVRAGRW